MTRKKFALSITAVLLGTATAISAKLTREVLAESKMLDEWQEEVKSGDLGRFQFSVLYVFGVTAGFAMCFMVVVAWLPYNIYQWFTDKQYLPPPWLRRHLTAKE